MKTCKEYRDQAANTLKGMGGALAVVTLVYGIVSGIGDAYNFMEFGWVFLAVTEMFCIAFSICVTLPLGYGFERLFLHIAKDEEVKEPFDYLFMSFGKGYGRSIGVMFLQGLYTFLWMLLLIVPGCIKAYAYSMAVYISDEHPEYSADMCISESQRIMKGHKMELFLLDLSYIGWLLLSVLTLFILTLWITPKMHTAHAHFYLDLKQELGIGIPEPETTNVSE